MKYFIIWLIIINILIILKNVYLLWKTHFSSDYCTKPTH